MNWQPQYALPLFAATNGRTLTLADAVALRKAHTAAPYDHDAFLSSSGLCKAKDMPQPVAQKLVLSRLRGEDGTPLRFLMGKDFTAQQIAIEIERGTPDGRYFLQIELRALELVQEAFARSASK